MKSEKNFELTHRLRRAEEFEGGGKLLHAIQMYQAITDDFHDDPTAWYKLVEIYEKMGKEDSAMNLIEEMLEHFNDDEDIRLFAGHFYFKHQMWEDSIRVLENLEDMNFDTITYFIYGLSCFHTGRFEDAIQKLSLFLELEKDSAFLGDTNLYLAECYMILGKLNVALPHLERAAQLMPTNPEVYHFLAAYYFQIKMTAHAAEHIETAISLGATMTGTWELGAMIYEKMKDMSRLERLCRKYIAEENEPSPVMFNALARAVLEKNKYSEAEGYLRSSLAIDPNDRDTIELMNMLNKKRDDDLVKDI